MNPFEIVIYVLTIISMFASIVGYLLHKKAVVISSFIALMSITIVWSILEILGVFSQ